MTEGADDLDVDPGGQLARWTQSATSPVVDIWLYTAKGKLPPSLYLFTTIHDAAIPTRQRPKPASLQKAISTAQG